jgi:PhnB protein
MSTINAYIRFKNNCRQAMTFYQECLGGELDIQIVKDSPMKDMFPPQLQDIVLHASLEIRRSRRPYHNLNVGMP